MYTAQYSDRLPLEQRGQVDPLGVKVKRLMDLFLNEFARKKNKRISDIPNDVREDILIQFWRDSLCRDKIIHKLQTKKQQKTEKGKNGQEI